MGYIYYHPCLTFDLIVYVGVMQSGYLSRGIKIVSTFRLWVIFCVCSHARLCFILDYTLNIKPCICRAITINITSSWMNEMQIWIWCVCVGTNRHIYILSACGTHSTRLTININICINTALILLPTNSISIIYNTSILNTQDIVISFFAMTFSFEAITIGIYFKTFCR